MMTRRFIPFSGFLRGRGPFWRNVLPLALVLLGGGLPGPARGEDVAVSVDEAMQQRYQLATAPLERRPLARGRAAFGEILDPAPLLRAWRDWSNAKIEADQAEREAARTRQLAQAGQLASAHAVEAAETRALLAAAALEARAETLQLDWGTLGDSLLGGDKVPWVDGLRTGASVLVRLSLPVGQALPRDLGAALVWPVNSAGAAVRAAGIWPARHASPQAAPGFIALVQPASGAWPIGLAVEARLERPGAESTGIRVPADAVVYAAGAAWIYQATAPGTFARRAVSTDVPDGAGGWIVAVEALADNQPVVVHGAQALLAEETLRAMGAGEDEDE